MAVYTPGAYAKRMRSASYKSKLTTQKVLKRGALKIKLNSRMIVTNSHSNAGKQRAGYHINFEAVGLLAYEIGYDKNAGSLGTMNEYGSAGNSPDGALGLALDEESDQVEVWLSKEIEKLL